MRRQSRRLPLDFHGHHWGTKNPVCIVGWEEWDLDPDYKVKVEALTMKVEWPAFTVERWPNHSPDQLRLA